MRNIPSVRSLMGTKVSTRVFQGHRSPCDIWSVREVSHMHELDGNRYAHREGLFARALGRPVEGNPYPTNSEEGVLWKEGWRLIDERHSHAVSVYAGSPASVSALRHQVRSGPSHS